MIKSMLDICTNKKDDLDDASIVLLHKKAVSENTFLRKIYEDYYKEFKILTNNVPNGLKVEIGSGGGFIKEIIPEVITSDIVPSEGIDMVFPATKIPFSDKTVSAFFLQNVLHHIGEPIEFFNEMNRCLVEHGKIVLIEPYNSFWGRFIRIITYGLHKESFNINSGWKTCNNNRMTGANWALPWLIFFKDRKIFESKFPNLKINKLFPHSPFRYIFSGGVSAGQLIPPFTYNIVKRVENSFPSLSKHLGMFFTVELEKYL